MRSISGYGGTGTDLLRGRRRGRRRGRKCVPANPTHSPPAPHPFPIIAQYYTLFRHNNYFINSKPEFGDKTLNQ